MQPAVKVLAGPVYHTHTSDYINLVVFVLTGQQIDGVLERLRVEHESCDIPEQDPLLGEVGHPTNGGLDGLLLGLPLCGSPGEFT